MGIKGRGQDFFSFFRGNSPWHIITRGNSENFGHVENSPQYSHSIQPLHPFHLRWHFLQWLILFWWIRIFSDSAWHAFLSFSSDQGLFFWLLVFFLLALDIFSFVSSLLLFRFRSDYFFSWIFLKISRWCWSSILSSVALHNTSFLTPTFADSGHALDWFEHISGVDAFEAAPIEPCNFVFECLKLAQTGAKIFASSKRAGSIGWDMPGWI